MLNSLKESSKKSPFQYRFGSETGKGKGAKDRALQEDLSPRGIKISFKGSDTSLELVMEKRFFVIAFIALCLYIFGGETGNIWSYLLTSVALTALFFGLLVPLLQVLETSIHFHLPAEAVARERLNLRVKMERRSFLGGGLGKFLPVKWLLVKIKLVRLGEAENMLRPIMVEHLTGEAWVVAQTPRLRRGVYNLEAIEIFSCYPFGLCWWTKRYKLTDKLAEELTRGLDDPEREKLYGANKTAAATRTGGRLPQMTVFPRINNVDGNFLFRLRAAGDSALFFSSSRPIAALSSASVRSLREFRSGDSPRFIHWPSSAKTGKLMIREFESEGLPGFDVLLDLTSDWKSEDQFELAVSITLSLLQLGFRLGGAPELFVIPSLDEDIEKLPQVLSDLPPIARGIGWASQILARVEALEVKNDDYRVCVPAVGMSDTLALLTVRPSNISLEEAEMEASKRRDEDEMLEGSAAEAIRRSREGRPDDAIKALSAGLLRQVDLWVLSRTFLEADSTIMAGKQAPIPLHAQGTGDRRSAPPQGVGAGQPTQYGRILASLAEFEELAHL